MGRPHSFLLCSQISQMTPPTSKVHSWIFAVLESSEELINEVRPPKIMSEGFFRRYHSSHPQNTREVLLNSLHSVNSPEGFCFLIFIMNMRTKVHHWKNNETQTIAGIPDYTPPHTCFLTLLYFLFISTVSNFSISNLLELLSILTYHFQATLTPFSVSQGSLSSPLFSNMCLPLTWKNSILI